MIKFGDVVWATHADRKHKRIFLGEYDKRFLLIYGDIDLEEADAFRNAEGSPLTYWVEEIEEVYVPSIDVGLNYQDLLQLQKMVSCGGTIEHCFKDHDGNKSRLVFMTEDEMKQRST